MLRKIYIFLRILEGLGYMLVFLGSLYVRLPSNLKLGEQTAPGVLLNQYNNHRVEHKKETSNFVVIFSGLFAIRKLNNKVSNYIELFCSVQSSKIQ